MLPPTTPKAAHLEDLWETYLTYGDLNSKSALVEEYLPLVKRAVSRVRPFLPDFVQEEDLIGYGFVGLLEAIDRFERDKGVPFEAYAVKRIQGSILDGLRAMSWLPRNLHRQAKHVEDTIEDLRSRLGRQPTEDEVASGLGMSVTDYHMLLSDVGPITLMPFDEITEHGGIDQDSQPWDKVERAELLAAVARSIEDLPEREKLVVTLYFHRDLTLKEIAQILDVSEGRACQLKTQALLRLRAALHQQGFAHPGDAS
ncbi:MAG: FliA/WhiG family RNA polymerase sigma factor [Fimbriimonadaceae bacterium]|nr:FliA/WhiG family RNA polymerase sigma factor [Fimbriimonadaceae bacterium]